ncbi:MAG TPA: hypothetical protein H9689_01025, partial [Firmicutes bacterium]|nr:hypothetical protein [Bacillota bacterium]
ALFQAYQRLRGITANQPGNGANVIPSPIDLTNFIATANALQMEYLPCVLLKNYYSCICQIAISVNLRTDGSVQ